MDRSDVLMTKFAQDGRCGNNALGESENSSSGVLHIVGECLFYNVILRYGDSALSSLTKTRGDFTIFIGSDVILDYRLY